MSPPEKSPPTAPSGRVPGANPPEIFQRALALHGEGQLAAAEPLYLAVLAADPDHFNALNNLGLLLARRGDVAEAIVMTRRAIALDPNSARSHSNLGRMLAQSGQFGEARTAYEKSLTLDPTDTLTLGQFAALLRSQHCPADALPWLESAIELRPQDAELYHLLGGLMNGLGRTEEARQCFEKAITLRASGHYYRDLSLTKTFAAADPMISTMEALLRQPALPAGERMALHFALGKAFSDIGENDISFRHRLDANRIRRAQTVYDEAAALNLIETIKSGFTAKLLQARSGLGVPSDVPVFVVGMPRCGSTLVEQILTSHPDVAGIGESAAFEHSLRAQFPLADFVEIGSAASASQLQKIGALYLQTVTGGHPAAQRITDKMLPNFLHAGLIHMIFPNARIIHVRRDAIDTCLSCFSTEFPAGAPYLYDLGELGRYYRAYAGLMGHWRNVLPDGVLLDVRYEDVVSDIETQARRMIAHCGLPWDDACLAFQASKRPIWTASAAQVRQPIYASSVGRWRPSADLLKPLLDGLGDLAV